MNIIQIGCNDCKDRVYDYILSNKDIVTKFLVIDALPKCVEMAKERYSFLGEKLIAINCAIAPQRGIMKIFFPKDDQVSAHASLLQFHVKNHRHNLLDFFYVPVLNINDIISSFEEIDRLYIDIEGLDAITLLNFNFNYIKPKYIEYEFYHSDGSFSFDKNHNSLISLLESVGYKLKKSGEYNIIAELN